MNALLLSVPRRGVQMLLFAPIPGPIQDCPAGYITIAATSKDIQVDAWGHASPSPLAHLWVLSSRLVSSQKHHFCWPGEGSVSPLSPITTDPSTSISEKIMALVPRFTSPCTNSVVLLHCEG